MEIRDGSTQRRAEPTITRTGLGWPQNDIEEEDSKTRYELRTAHPEQFLVALAQDSQVGLDREMREA